MTPELAPLSPAVAAASQAAAQAWAAAMQQRRQPCAMSPPDEIQWFDNPIFSTFLLPYAPAQSTQIALPNVMRTSISFSLISQGILVSATNQYPPTIMVGPLAGLVAAGISIPGFAVTQYTPMITISADVFPGLVQGPWFAYNSLVTGQVLPQQYLSVVEMILRDWPQRKR